MRKLFTIFAALALVILCIMLLPTDTQAAEMVDRGTCGGNLTWTLEDNGTLTIFGVGAMTDYPISNGSIAPWFYSRLSIKTIVIEDGVTSIGDKAFYECDNLVSITIPNSVTNVGNSAFENCDSLTSVTIGNGVTSIGNNAFTYCDNLTSVMIGNSVTSISDSAFSSCSSLQSINIPDNVTSIGNDAFRNCFSLAAVTIGNSVTSIESGAFQNCFSLASVTIGNSVTSIGVSAFFGCNSLQSIIIPSSVTSIGFSAFYDCAALSSITIPNNVTHINYTAFWCCDSLSTIIYCGTEEQWKQINFDLYNNDSYNFRNVKIRYHNCKNGICPVCQKSDSATHTWNSGKETKQATCKGPGVKTYTCSICSITKTESIAMLITHTYDNACDTSCNVCGTTRTTTHNYKSSWSKDKTNHWQECSGCGDKKDVTAHTPDAEATETTAQKCTVCGYVIKATLEHTHNYASEWKTDENGHWHVCSGCEEKGDYATHVWNDGEVTKEKLAKLDPPATESPSTQPEVTKPSATVPETPGEQTADQPESKFPWGIVIVAVAVMVGGMTVILIIKKKKSV